MNGFRFYEELENKNRKSERSKGTVIAVIPENRWWGSAYGADGKLHPVMYIEAVAAVQDFPNCGVASTSVTYEVLATCRRISEERAREIHPALFQYLDVSN